MKKNKNAYFSVEQNIEQLRHSTNLARRIKSRQHIKLHVATKIRMFSYFINKFLEEPLEKTQRYFVKQYKFKKIKR